jgi:hypothetical protein
MLCDMACRTNEGVVLKAPDHVVRGHFARINSAPHALQRIARTPYRGVPPIIDIHKHGPTCGVVIATLWICRGVPPCQPILCQMRFNCMSPGYSFAASLAVVARSMRL